MTGSTRQGHRRLPSLPTLLASLACFLLVFEFLAFQLRAGHDPAIGAVGGEDGAPAAATPRPVVIHRRIIVRRMVEDSAAGAASVPVGDSSTSSRSSSGTAGTAAPPAAAAPAPAPAPAPVTSSS